MLYFPLSSRLTTLHMFSVHVVVVVVVVVVVDVVVVVLIFVCVFVVVLFVCFLFCCCCCCCFRGVFLFLFLFKKSYRHGDRSDGKLPTEKPGAVLTRVRVPHATMVYFFLIFLFFLPKSAFSSDLFMVSVQPPCACSHMHQDL